MLPAVSYITCATSSREKTGIIIILSQFEEGNLLSETCDDTESDKKFHDNSAMPPLISAEEIDAMDSGDEPDGEPMSM